ncbi:eCIS core domain-containing protein, partial [Tahibacter caeni]|uniref:eCIS core domain-containing protein n=1 Tax=Tahibacter caeni TaxID=1453545 RepID=UPI003CCDB0AD
APGRPLERAQRDWFEPRLGRSLADVRVHDDALAARSARAISAKAYTAGRHVVFGAGQYHPLSAAGRALLAHELAHAQSADDVVRRKPLTDEERAEDLQSPELKDDARLQEAFDNAPDMRRKESGEGVKTLQRQLRDLGYPMPVSFKKTGDADGIFGEETEGVVKTFQRDHGLVDTGVVDRDTLRELDLVFNPVITIDKVFIGSDHAQVIDNAVDWSDAGARHFDWSNKPYQIVFDPADPTAAQTIPISVTGGTTLSAAAWVDIKGGVPGRAYTITATSAQTGFSLSGTGTHKTNEPRDLIFLTADAPVTPTFAELRPEQTWAATSTVATRSSGVTRQNVFVTAGPAIAPEAVTIADRPYRPTVRRLRQAMRFAAGTGVTRADRIIWKVMREFPSYGECDAPSGGEQNISCPSIVSVWGMSPYLKAGTFQCITIARYADALFYLLGLPNQVPGAIARPVVIWADIDNRDGIISPWPHAGISSRSYSHPRHRDWSLGLIDGNCGLNNYEACEQLIWTPPGAAKPVMQIWCGGFGKDNPAAGFGSARAVLEEVFTLSWYKPMKKPDPSSGFWRGIRQKDVENYAGIDGCDEDISEED